MHHNNKEKKANKIRFQSKDIRLFYVGLFFLTFMIFCKVFIFSPNPPTPKTLPSFSLATPEEKKSNAKISHRPLHVSLSPNSKKFRKRAKNTTKRKNIIVTRRTPTQTHMVQIVYLEKYK